MLLCRMGVWCWGTRLRGRFLGTSLGGLECRDGGLRGLGVERGLGLGLGRGILLFRCWRKRGILEIGGGGWCLSTSFRGGVAGVFTRY